MKSKRAIMSYELRIEEKNKKRRRAKEQLWVMSYELRIEEKNKKRRRTNSKKE